MWLARFSLEFPGWLRWTGAALGVVCIPLFFWILRSLGTNITPTVATRKDHTLITHGPYRWVRHPLYTVGMLFWTGISLTTANWLIGGTIILGTLFLVIRTPIEEEKLIEKFGDEYREYMKRTGRFFPRLRR